jgi:hypothetical protein
LSLDYAANNRNVANTMTETQSFSAPDLNLHHLAKAIVDWYRSQDFDVQQLDVQEGGILVQAKRGGWRNAVGMASALNVTLRQNRNNLLVEIGSGKWLDKAAVGAVSMVILWPLALAAAYGVWQQSQLPKRTFEFIQQYFSANTASMASAPSPFGTPGIEAVPANSVLTPTTASVGTVLPMAALQFCPACGKTVSDADRFCKSCGDALT